MPGASWVLLDSASAATCSAASLVITWMGVAKPARRSHRTRRFNNPIYATDTAAVVIVAEKLSARLSTCERAMNAAWSLGRSAANSS